MSTHIERIYATREKKGEVRILIDRLWPRGISKAKADIDERMPELAPSPKLRSWFHRDRERNFKTFAEKYRAELKDQSKLLTELRKRSKKERIVLLTATKDLEHSYLAILKSILLK